jgi:uncharacterized membrane protein
MKLSIKHIPGLTVLIILTVLAVLDGSNQDGQSAWLLFIGRFHPVILHLPIGLFAAVLLLELIGVFRSSLRHEEIIRVLVVATFVSAAIVSLCGIFLSWEGGYEKQSMGFHKWGGVITTALSFFLVVTSNFAQTTHKPLRKYYRWGLVAVVLVLTFTGHQGGTLTHGSDFLTEHIPFGKKKRVAGTGAKESVFATHIQPVFADYCGQCHGPEKIKGGLRLDTFEHILTGGENGPVLVAGNSERSLLVERLQLPLDNEEHMPPEGKSQPDADEIALLTWWIDQGADSEAGPGDLNITTEVAAFFVERQTLALRTKEDIETRLAALPELTNFVIYFLAKDDNRLVVRGDRATDEDVNTLLSVKENIVHLNLANSGISDLSMETVGEMTNLTSLQLQNTAITDAGIGALTSLYQLVHLNLYNTNITDRSLASLQQLKALKKIYLWQTGVTREAAAQLHRALYRERAAEKLRNKIDDLQQEINKLEVDIVSGSEEDLLSRLEDTDD